MVSQQAFSSQKSFDCGRLALLPGLIKKGHREDYFAELAIDHAAEPPSAKYKGARGDSSNYFLKICDGKIHWCHVLHIFLQDSVMILMGFKVTMSLGKTKSQPFCMISDWSHFFCLELTCEIRGCFTSFCLVFRF